jgi:antitoxin component YwqK of YwqJK toxin-antitoxin module
LPIKDAVDCAEIAKVLNNFDRTKILMKFRLDSCFLAIGVVVFTSLQPCQAQDLVPVSSRRQLPNSNTQDEPLDPSVVVPPLNIGGQQDIEELPRATTPNRDETTYDNYGNPIQEDITKFEPKAKEVIRQRYPDGKIQVERRVIQDEEGNYFNHGTWKLFNRRGQVLAEGNFAKGYMDGSWQRWHNKGSDGMFSGRPFSDYQGPFLSVTNFKKGKLHGAWIVFDPMRRKIFELGYRDGKRDGVALWWYPSGMKMRQMGFKQGALHGEFIEWDQQGRVQRREQYVDGHQIVAKTQNWGANQKRSEEYFLGPQMEVSDEDDWWNAKPAVYTTTGNEIQHGRSLAWYQNGQPHKRGQYSKGLRTGTFVWWYANGQKQTSGAYEDDSRVGNWVWWHDNGMKMIEGQFKEGTPIGKWRWWNEAGQIIRTADLDEIPENIEYELPDPDREINVSRNSTEPPESIQFEYDQSGPRINPGPRQN